MSPHRQEVIKFLNTISVKGRTLDVGGKKWSVVSSLKSFEGDYDTLQKEDYDLNFISPNIYMNYDNIFCCEVMQYVYNPLNVLHNLVSMLNSNGKMYLSFYRDFKEFSPANSDYLRYTEQGVRKLIEVAGLKISEWSEPIEGFYLVKCELR